MLKAPTPGTVGFREVRLTALLSLAGVQGAAAALDDCEHGHADLRWAGLRAGEGRARHHVLHPAPGEPRAVTCRVSRVTCHV